MNNKNLILAFICLIYISFANAILQKPVAPKGKVMIIRHAEKPPSGNDLSAMGWRRAECIREKFISNSTITPKTIYAQKASKKDDIPDSRRQIETVAPLARKLGYTIDNRFTSFQLDKLCEDVGQLSEDKFPVLISWNHEDIKNFLINFGMKYQIAPSYPSKRYDLVFVIERDIKNEVVFSAFSEECEGLGDYRFSNDAGKISQQWVIKSLVMTTIALALYFF